MITLKDYPKKEKSSCFLFKKSLVFSLFLWICQHCNNEGTISKTLGTGHNIDTTLDLRCNRLLARHELINTVDEENIKEQLGYNTQRKSVYLKSVNKLEKEAAKRGKVKSGNSSKSGDVKRLNIKFGDELKSEEGKNGNLKIKSELKSGNKIKKEEKEKNEGQGSENEKTEEVEAESDDQRSEKRLTEADAKAEVEAECDNQRRRENEFTEADAKVEVEAECDDRKSDNEMTEEEVEVEEEEEEGDQTGEHELIYEVNEKNDDEKCESKEPKIRVLNVEVFLQKKVKKKGKAKIELKLEKILEDEDELLYNDDYFIRKEGIDYFDGEGDDDELGNLEDYFTLDFDDDLKLDQDENDDENRKSTYTKVKRPNEFMRALKILTKLWRLLNIIGLLINTLTTKLYEPVEKLMFKAYAKVDEYKKDPNISKNKYMLINFTYKAFFFIIPIIIIAVGIGISQAGYVGTFGASLIISMGISFLIRSIKRSILYQFKRQGIDNPGVVDYINLLEKFLMKFDIEEENAEGENAEGEHPEGEHPEGENTDGGKSEGENPEEEHPEGENTDGGKSEGENPEGEHPEGENTDEVKSEGENPEGERKNEENTKEEPPKEKF